MKTSTWNIITGAILLVWVIVVIVMISIFTNPSTGINPFKFPTLPPTVEIPTSTATLIPFPPTWTATAAQSQVIPTMTQQPTNTGFVLPTLTPTATSTSTRTRTPTITRTPKPTKTPTP